MEKLLWAGIALLWTTLIATAAFAGDAELVPPHGSARDAGFHNALSHNLMMSHDTAAIVSVAATGSQFVSPGIRSTADQVWQSGIEPSDRGTGEVAGAVLVAVAFAYRAARRRRLI